MAEATPHIGIRDLRADLAAHVRRAGAGDAVVITIDGRPVARLAPLGDGPNSLDDLLAAGLVEPPRRAAAPNHEPAQPIAGLDSRSVLRELRGT